MSDAPSTPAERGESTDEEAGRDGSPADEFDPVETSDEDPDLRPGADPCYKCSACDTSCPVAAVDDEFPGPKFQGPEQWRLKRKEDAEIDGSVMKCSNCMRCDGACPTGVPLSRMHNTARAEYVEENLGRLSREYWRNRILANYGTLAGIGSKVPRLTNLVMGSTLVGWLNEKLLGLTGRREFPEFATETFREWWRARGGPAIEHDEKRIAYFHGDYANYNTPEVAKALVRVFEGYGYEVRVPTQRCSGTPMFANGMLDDARRAAEANVETFADLVDEGYDVVCSCTSCSMALRREYPELFDLDGVGDVAAHTWEALEYLRVHEDLAGDLADAEVAEADLAGADGPVGEGGGGGGAALAYHAPCHARNQGLDGQALDLFGDLAGVEVADVGDSCSGISGTYGWKTENYETSMAIGDGMFEHMEAVPGETGLTECPTCAMQMEHGTGYEIRHPLEVVEAALVEGR